MICWFGCFAFGLMFGSNLKFLFIFSLRAVVLRFCAKIDRYFDSSRFTPSSKLSSSWRKTAAEPNAASTVLHHGYGAAWRCALLFLCQTLLELWAKNSTMVSSECNLFSPILLVNLPSAPSAPGGLLPASTTNFHLSFRRVSTDIQFLVLSLLHILSTWWLPLRCDQWCTLLLTNIFSCWKIFDLSDGKILLQQLNFIWG